MFRCARLSTVFCRLCSTHSHTHTRTFAREHVGIASSEALKFWTISKLCKWQPEQVCNHFSSDFCVSTIYFYFIHIVIVWDRMWAANVFYRKVRAFEWVMPFIVLLHIFFCLFITTIINNNTSSRSKSNNILNTKSDWIISQRATSEYMLLGFGVLSFVFGSQMKSVRAFSFPSSTFYFISNNQHQKGSEQEREGGRGRHRRRRRKSIKF